MRQFKLELDTPFFPQLISKFIITYNPVVIIA